MNNDILNKLYALFTLKNMIPLENYFFNGDNIVIQYVTPHEGNNHQHMIMAEYVSRFDKWGNCAYEEVINADNLMRVITELKLMDNLDAKVWDSLNPEGE